MIKRIVKLVFRDSMSESFAALSVGHVPQIMAFEGCSHVEILRDINQPNQFFSYSFWQSEAHLNTYRKSEFFRGTWKTIKPWFSAKPEAWSVEVCTNVKNK